ncbi:MAG TPA: sulfotransferase [Solirubrobacteraceae bacterium]|nr:sulfotransferase [Solirubrobacteraceae bacterium]
MGGTLDFIVIGAQRSGTTSLWHALADHPQIHIPASKEAPFFSHATFERGLSWYLAEYFCDAAPDRLWGTVSPQYMMGSRHADEGEIARRIRASVPQAKLIAILRDPLERAWSQYRQLAHRGGESRSFEAVVSQLLEPAALRDARRPGASQRGCQRYIVAGEYGRLLGAYLDVFPRERLHTLFTSDLARDPHETLRSVFEFLGVEATRRMNGGPTRHNRGGVARRIDEQAEASLKDYLAREVWPAMPWPRLAERAFDFWLMEWNVVAEEASPQLSPALRSRIEAHFDADAARLEALLGAPVPWRPQRVSAGAA